jgi:AcrB/AcrD/AcrF family
MVENGYRHLSERTTTSTDPIGEMSDSNGPVLKESGPATSKPAKHATEPTNRWISVLHQIARLQMQTFTRPRSRGVQRLRPKLMTVCAVLASLIPILWASGIGSDVMKTIAAPMVGGMITSTIHVLILVPVFFVLMKERALRRGAFAARGD